MTNNPFTGKSQLFFANKDDMDFKPLDKVVNNPILEHETPIAFAPTMPFHFSFNLPKVKRKSWKKKDWVLLLWQDQPSNLKYPNKKRKWRVKKKWFNRYEKPRLINCVVKATNIESEQHLIGKVIVDVKLRKAGGHETRYDQITLLG